MAKSPTIRLAAAAGQRISVGLNYPWAWNKWGAFFGSGEKVPGDCPDYDRWLSNLDRNLGSIADIVSVVRIFLFGNFCNLGTVKMGVGPPRRRSGVPVTPWYNFVPPRTVSSIGCGSSPARTIHSRIDHLTRRSRDFGCGRGAGTVASS
jgi:hypothetical protein